jgi:NhaP-type Na+/H+ or K+/H+ antiporter
VAEKPALLAATYAVAVFTILVQGATLGSVARRSLSATAGRTPAGQRAGSLRSS